MSQNYKSELSVTFLYERFWEGFDTRNNFMTRLFEVNEEKFSLSSSESTKVVKISSHFEQTPTNLTYLKLAVRHFLAQSLKRNKELSDKNNVYSNKSSETRIFYTAENFRVPANEQLSLSHDLDDYDSKNVYFPYLFDHLLMSKLGQHDHLFGSKIGYDYMFSGRKLINKPQKYASIFYNNDLPFRRRIIALMSEHGKVDEFGKASGKYLDDRQNLFGQYRFVLCPENDFYPGYVTEKIMHAYAMGAIPVYWGGLTRHQGVNRRALIEINPHKDLREQFMEIGKMNIKDYRQIYEQPLMNKEPNWGEIYKKIRFWIDSQQI